MIISVPSILCAQTTEQESYRKLADALHRQVCLLSSITSESTAQAALPKLKEIMSELSALNQQVNSEQLWRYIENTPDIKQPILEDAEQLLVELQRLESKRFFSVSPLRNLLRPLLTPAS